jgi:3-oxoacyl-(acyl-carrier-protein) synthase
MSDQRKRIGIFGWGVVAPRSPNIEQFENNLRKAESWLEPFEGFGPNNFLVGAPAFDFNDYRAWVDERFEPRKFAQLESKMGDMVKYAIGAFIQSLGQNPGIEGVLQELGQEAHIYVGTGLGDLAVVHEISRTYDRAQRRWYRFWCRDEHNPALAAYRATSEDERETARQAAGAPPDPAALNPEDEGYEQALDEWLAFWAERSEGLAAYLAELREIEAVGINGNIDTEKGHVIKRKMVSRRKLNKRYGCPEEPWNSVEAKLLWNIPNIPAAQISMLGKITGTTLAPIAACSGFGTSLLLADNAIQLGKAKAAVIGMTDPAPHQLTVGGFYRARVVAQDGQVSKPFTGLRGTHVSGGACIWIVGDVDYFRSLGMKPLGLEIVGVANNSDADHIITPSREGPRAAIALAMAEAGAEPGEVATWDMHATATPGDWTELQNTLSVFPGTTRLTARKGSFGHGMSVCGGWELTAQHMGFAQGILHPIDLAEEEIHPQILEHRDSLVVQEDGTELDGGRVAGKLNMGVGGVNACVISRLWED